MLCFLSMPQLFTFMQCLSSHDKDALIVTLIISWCSFASIRIETCTVTMTDTSESFLEEPQKCRYINVNIVHRGGSLNHVDWIARVRSNHEHMELNVSTVLWQNMQLGSRSVVIFIFHMLMDVCMIVIHNETWYLFRVNLSEFRRRNVF